MLIRLVVYLIGDLCRPAKEHKGLSSKGSALNAKPKTLTLKLLKCPEAPKPLKPLPSETPEALNPLNPLDPLKPLNPKARKAPKHPEASGLAQMPGARHILPQGHT